MVTVNNVFKDIKTLSNNDIQTLFDNNMGECNRSILLDEKWPLKMDVIFYNMVFLRLIL